MNTSAVPPFLRHAPPTAPLPLVLDSPHSGEHYPDDFYHAPPRDVVRQAEDTHVARLYSFAPKFGATLIEAMFPRAFGAVWHIDCHSMAAVGDAYSDDAGRPRKDFVLGDRDGTTCAPAFTALVAQTLAGLGYSVSINDPYKGVEIVRRYGGPNERRHSLQIEINRRLYMDEATLEPTVGYKKLEADLERLLAAVSAYVQRKV